MRHSPKLVSCASVIALALAGSSLFVMARRDVTPSLYRRAALGMAEADLLRLAGPPRTRFDPRPSRVVPHLDDGDVADPSRRFASLRDGTFAVTRHPSGVVAGTMLIWEGDGGQFTAYLDVDGKVVGKVFNLWREETWGEWAARRAPLLFGAD